MINRIVISIVMFGVSVGVFAKEIELPKTSQVCIDDGAYYRVDKAKLLHWALSRSDLGLICIAHENMAPPSFDKLASELTTAVNDDESDYIPSFCPGATKKQIAKFLDQLSDTFEALNSTHGGVLSEKSPYRVENRIVDSGDLSDFGMYQHGAATKVICHKAEPKESAKVGSFTGKWVFRETFSEFSKKMLSAATGGKVAYENTKTDKGVETTTNTTKFVWGRKFNRNTDGFFREITPYFLQDSTKTRTRKYVDGSDLTKRLEYRGGGVFLRGEIDGSNHSNHYLDFTVSYTKEHEENNETGAVDLRYTPEMFTWLNDWEELGPALVYTEFYIGAKAAKILEEGYLEGGELLEFIDGNRYSAIGTGVSLRFKSALVAQEKVEFKLGYSYFDLSRHKLKHTDLSTLTLNYFFDDDKRYGVEASYQKGEDGVFLEKVDKKSLSLTARF